MEGGSDILGLEFEGRKVKSEAEGFMAMGASESEQEREEWQLDGSLMGKKKIGPISPFMSHGPF